MVLTLGALLMRCSKCGRDLPRSEFEHNSSRGRHYIRKQCRPCRNRQRLYLKAQRRESAYGREPIAWRTIKVAYRLTRREQKAVQEAADCLIRMHGWKRSGGPKPPVPATITDALTDDWIRQAELMGATSRLAHWLLWQDGHDPAAFFNRGIRTGRCA